MDRLTSMAAFVKAVEAGSFSAAGEALGMSSQLVGKHVRMLEEHFGIQLLNRTTRRQSLTAAGREFLERAQQILGAVEAAEAFAEESRAVPRGVLRINAPVTFGVHELTGALPEFLELYPEVSLELTLTDRMVDLIDEGFDAVFRIGPLGDSGLIARALRPYERLLCAAPSYLERCGTPMLPDDLRSHTCLGFAHADLSGVWRFVGRDGPIAVPISSRLTINNGQALLTAARAGLGIIYQPTALLRDDVEAGRLIRLLADFEAQARPMHIIYASHRRVTPKLRSFIDFAIARFAGKAP